MALRETLHEVITLLSYKTEGFLMFSGGIKWKIGLTWVEGTGL